MTTIIFGGGSSFGGGVQSNSPGSPTIQATAGSVTTVTGTINQPINNVSTFSSVQYGISPYTYSISSGTLPTGVTLDSNTGIISGIPTATQSSSSVTVSVTDSLGVTASITSTVAFTVGSAIMATANSVAPVQTVQNGTITNVTPFASVSGGTLPYWYFVSSGTLPDRVTLDPTTGLVSGTPTQTYSTASVTFSVRDGGGIVAATTSTVSFTVNAALSATAGATTAVNAIQNTAITSFNPFSSVVGGYTPYVYGIVSGTLPTGVTLNTSTGLVSGTPTTLQSAASVTFKVTDAQGYIATTITTVNFTVNTSISATAGATTTVSGYQSTAITNFNPFSSVTGGYTPYVYGISSGTLPTGITLDTSTGLVSGTPSATYATANVTFKVTDAQGYIASTTKTVGFTVNAALSATATSTTNVVTSINLAIVGFNAITSVTGGYTPYTYYVSSGTLPTGININSSTGLVSGTPTVAYPSANVVFSVKDVNNVVASTTATINFAVTGASYTVNYLVVGGGGGGMAGCTIYSGGGGGAGGFVPGTACFTAGVTYSITVGNYGAGGVAPGSGGVGGNSVISGSGITTITAVGGGGGVFNSSPTAPYGVGSDGGSGGGSGGTSGALGGKGQNYPGPTQQGYPGGASGAGGGAGGGGAGGVGGIGNNPAGGAGGVGKLWPYTGITYAGGGGGGGELWPGVYPGNGQPGAGGSGIGGPGGSGVPTQGTNGSPAIPLGANTGSGGGGGGAHQPGTVVGNPGGSGSNGIVILAIPTPNYPGSAPGATVTTPPNAPGKTVLTFTTSGTYAA